MRGRPRPGGLVRLWNIQIRLLWSRGGVRRWLRGLRSSVVLGLWLCPRHTCGTGCPWRGRLPLRLDIRPWEVGLRRLRTGSGCWSRWCLPRKQPPMRGGQIGDRMLPVEILLGIVSCEQLADRNVTPPTSFSGGRHPLCPYVGYKRARNLITAADSLDTT